MRTQTTLKSSGVAPAVALAICFCVCAGSATAQSYSITNLVADTPGVAPITDPNLQNPWGLVSLQAGPWWVSDNNNGLSTLYDGQGNIQGLVVTVPPSSADATAKGSPTGIVGNSTTAFGGAAFLYDSEDGTIQAWSGAPSSVIKVDKGKAAVYKGLATATITIAGKPVQLLYATNFRAGTVEVYNSNFQPLNLGAGAFADPDVPAGFAPFGIQNIGGALFVTFAKQNAAKHDDVPGPGLGYVDKFSPSGKLLLQLQHGKYMNAPWGIATGATFGTFSNDLILGNFGSGTLQAFDPTTGKLKGLLKDSAGKALVIPGLWALQFGQGGASGPANWLYFTAGPGNQKHGLFGFLAGQ